MKKLKFIYSILFFITLISSSVWADFASDFVRDFVFDYTVNDLLSIHYQIGNETGNAIKEIYISKSTEDGWGGNQWQQQDLFGSGYICNATSEDVGPYDFRAVDVQNRIYEKKQIRITDGTQVVFTQSDLKASSAIDEIGERTGIPSGVIWIGVILIGLWLVKSVFLGKS